MNNDIKNSPLYSEDLAPIPVEKRTWGMWSLAALWVGMAVCIPTYMLASQFILNGITWWESLLIIGLANIIITVPMVLSGHAGVKYGIPFPVLGRSAFGHNGIHLPAIIRGLIAAVWFGIQTWIGGIAIYSLWGAVTGTGIDMAGMGPFVGFFIFWLINVYFIWKGTESIKWLEIFAAPILILMGIVLIGWGSMQVGSFGAVLEQGKQLETPSANIMVGEKMLMLSITPLKDKTGKTKATEYRMTLPGTDSKEVIQGWRALNENTTVVPLYSIQGVDHQSIAAGEIPIGLEVRKQEGADYVTSSKIDVLPTAPKQKGFLNNIWSYLVMLTAMVGFWATMSISIADITRYTKSQKDQIGGQFIGLPGTMILYSFVGIFVTCAAVLVFDDVLLRDDAPWDPAALLAKFDSPMVVIVAQVFLIIATLSTNIAANVIAPANAFANALPKAISFRTGGIITAVLGIIICPWWIINHIIPFLLMVSSLLGPVVAILICDYFLIRKTDLDVEDLFKVNGQYSYNDSGINTAAMIAFVVGVLVAGVGYFVPALSFLYDISWFSGFLVSFVVYYFLQKNTKFPKKEDLTAIRKEGRIEG